MNKKISDTENPFAYIDELTGIRNKDGMINVVKEYLGYTSVHAPFALLVVDVKQFHSINDSFGHMFGDNVLIQVADCIIENINMPDYVARIGADEFAVFLKNVSKTAVVSMADKIRRAIKSIYIGEKTSADTYIGGIVCREPATDVMDLFQTASDAVEAQKKVGKPGVNVVTEVVPCRKELSFSAIYDRNYMNAINSKEKRLSELIFDLLEQAKDLDRAIHAVLTLVGEKRGLSRISVYGLQGRKLVKNYVWAKRGIDIPDSLDGSDILELQKKMDGISLEPGMGVFDEEFLDNYAPHLKEKILVAGAKSIMYCYMLEFGEIVGIMFYVDTSGAREWSDKDYKAYKTVTRQISAYTLKGKAIKLNK